MYLYNRGCNWSKLHKWFIAPWHGHKLVPHLWLLVRSRRSAKHRGNSLITRAFIRSARCLVFWADVLTALEHSPHCAWMCVCECMFVCVCADRVCVWESECVYVCVCVCVSSLLSCWWRLTATESDGEQTGFCFGFFLKKQNTAILLKKTSGDLSCPSHHRVGPKRWACLGRTSSSLLRSARSSSPAGKNLEIHMLSSIRSVQSPRKLAFAKSGRLRWVW